MSETRLDPTGRLPSPDGTPLAPDPPGASLWLVYLYLRPASFFRHYVLRSVPALTVIAAWAYGMAGLADRIDTRLVIADLSGRTSPYAAIAGAWALYWGAVIAGGALNGLATYLIGGWWYRKRIGFCGDTGADPALARRVYVFASQAYTIPYLCYLAWETFHYETPAAAAAGEDIWALAIPVALFWSVYVSYRGVRTVFPVRRWPARLWFLILPSAVYAVALVGIVLAVLGVSGAFSSEPDLSRPVTVDRPLFRFERPGNWDVTTDDEGDDPDLRFSVEPAFADAAVHFWIFDFPVDPQVEVDRTRTNLAGSYEIRRSTPIATWGAHEGRGYEHEVTVEGASLRMTSFCATSPSASFEILEAAEESVAARMRPGFDLIRRSFALKGAVDAETASP